MARLIYDAADAAARVDHVLSLFLQGEVAHGDLIFNATLARAVGQTHHSPVQRFPIAMFISSTSRALRALIKCFPGTTHQFPAVFYESGAHLLCFCAHAFARYFDKAAEMLSANADDPDFGTNRALLRIGRIPPL